MSVSEYFRQVSGERSTIHDPTCPTQQGFIECPVIMEDLCDVREVAHHFSESKSMLKYGGMEVLMCYASRQKSIHYFSPTRTLGIRRSFTQGPAPSSEEP